MGAVERILVRSEPGGPSHDVHRVRAVPGRGLEGDRYYTSDGTFWVEGKPGQDLTLIEAEALEALAGEHGIEIDAGETGRNVLTRGVDLNALVGRRFRIGELECYGDRPCDPCATLERHTQPGVMRGLAGRGGPRARPLPPGGILGRAPVPPPGQPP